MTAIPPPSILTLLQGQWSLNRQYFGVPGSLRGRAIWLPDASDGLHYAEEGVLQIGAARMSATRRYDFRPAGDAVEIRFADGPSAGGLFLRLIFVAAADGMAVASASHLCAADLYEGEWRIGRAELHATITASGPHKAYRMISRYDRLVEGA